MQNYIYLECASFLEVIIERDAADLGDRGIKELLDDQRAKGLLDPAAAVTLRQGHRLWNGRLNALAPGLELFCIPWRLICELVAKPDIAIVQRKRSMFLRLFTGSR